MLENDQRPKVTVEDLLRLKRAERPAPEFWTTFERELRQKQLSALLEKRAWWQDLSRLFPRRAYLPVGATAVIAFTLISVRYYAPTPLAQPQAATSDRVAPATATLEAPAPVARVSSPLVNRSESAGTQAEPVAVTVSAPAPTAAAAEDPVELMPLLVAPRETEKPSTRLLTVDLARLDQPEAGNFTATALGSRPSVPVSTAATAKEELASVPTETGRNARLLARYTGRQVGPEMAPSVVRERLTRRLGETETSDHAGRIARDIDAFARPMPQIVALRF